MRRPVLATLVLAALLALGCDAGGYRARPLDGAHFTGIMEATRAAVLADDYDAFAPLYPATYGETSIGADWTVLQRQRARFGDARMSEILAPAALGSVTFPAEQRQIDFDLWFDFPEGLGRYKSCFQTVWTFRPEGEDGEWRLADLVIHHPTFHYDHLHGDLVRLPRTRRLMLDLDWERAPDPEPLWRRTRAALLARDVEALHRSSVAGAVAACGDRRIDLPNVATLDAGGETNRRSTRRYTEAQVKELDRFCRELRTTPEELAPLFEFFPLESVPESCRMLRMKIGYSGRGLEFGTHRVTVSWTGFRPDDRWLNEGMWVEYAETAGF